MTKLSAVWLILKISSTSAFKLFHSVCLHFIITENLIIVLKKMHTPLQNCVETNFSSRFFFKFIKDLRQNSSLAKKFIYKSVFLNPLASLENAPTAKLFA